MTRTLRFVLSAAAALFALAFAGTAFAAYDPSLLVAGTNHALSRGGPLVIGFGQSDNDDATGVATVYSPLGYGVTLTQPAGTTLGSLSAVVKVGSLGGARVNVEGTVKTDNPASYVTNQCSPGAHEAVWILEFTVSGNQVRWPMYVDRVTTAPESAYASARMRVCLPTPYLPPPQGAPAGASLIIAAFSVRGVFTNPGTRGSYPWNGVFVPYTPGTATPNQANAAQSSSFVRVPMRLTMTAKRQRRGKRTFAVVTACVREAGQGIRGIRIGIHGGATAAKANNIRAKRLAGGATNARGCTTSRVRVRTKALFLRAVADVPARQAPACQPTIVPRCSQPSIAPAFDLSSGRAKRVRR
ncbi:MAG TPA: hypothetical protein VE440_09725 [Gaiellaceae bacterium]|nr:hypothetical protein [Gaiellaceae bacterium]